MVRIMVVEDEDLLRELILQSISSQNDFQCVGETGSASEAVSLCEKLHPDMILMDIKTKDGNGITATAEIKARFPEVKVLILTVLSSENTVNSAMKAGADGYALKSISVTELMHIIRHTINGYGLVPLMQKRQGKPATFSSLEITILQLLAEGKTTHDIAEKLHYSTGTVRNYISAMISRMEFADRVQLVSFALTEGMIN